jgi:pimeloyl-ACP methyl ester carboxylesterase
MKRNTIIILLTTVSILAAGCAYFQQQNERIKFLCDCSKFGLDSIWADSNKVSCFLIPVHKNVAAPDSGKYSLAVVIAKAIHDTKQPPLLYLHGGPGIATIENLKRYLESPTWKLLREQRDLVFFDYRGTGFSDPQLCNYIQDSLATFISTNASSQDISAKENSLYKNCRETLLTKGVNLADFTSFQLAADAEAIRRALQITDWNIYGVSYGTTVALNLLRSFPSNIKSVILDSPFPPNAPWNDFVRPFDTCFRALENNLLKDSVNARIFPSIRKDYVKAVSRLNKKPAQLSNEQNGTRIEYKYDGDDFAWSIWSAMLSPKSIPYVPIAIQEIANGNDSILQQWSTAFSSPDAYGKFSEAQSHAILCFEARPQNFEDTKESLTMKYPDFISFNSGYNTQLCDVWRPEIANKEIFEPVVSDVPVLVLSGEFDPVCPPLFGTITAKTLTNSTLIIVPAASHAAIHADDCLRKIANDFILNPRRKPPTQCVYDRKKIDFVTSDLTTALRNY